MERAIKGHLVLRSSRSAIELDRLDLMDVDWLPPELVAGSDGFIPGVHGLASAAVFRSAPLGSLIGPSGRPRRRGVRPIDD